MHELLFTSLGVSKLHWGWFAVVALFLTGCSGHRETPRVRYIPLPELERVYGPIVTAGNLPTPDQNGTGDRLGLFRDAQGTIWGLPVSTESDGRLLGCSPLAPRDARITDTYPAGATVIGATNEPTGWRGGTGNLELLLRDRRGTVRWQAVKGGQIVGGPVCWVKELPGLPQQLNYYRIAPATASGK